MAAIKLGKVDALIASASGRASGQRQLPEPAMADMLKVLAHNDNAGNHRNRVSMDEFLDHLRDAHKLEIAKNTLARILRDDLKRKTWATPGANAELAPGVALRSDYAGGKKTTTRSRLAAKKAGR